MSGSKYFKVPIPKGYRIFFSEMEIAGVSFRKSDVIKAFHGKDVALAIEAEPSNKFDKNALKVIAFKKGFFRKKKLHLGYIPKEIASVISDQDLNHDLLPRPKEFWVGDRGGMKVVIDILGLKNEYSKLGSV